MLVVVVLVAGAGLGAYSQGYLDRLLCDIDGTSTRCPSADIPPPPELNLPTARRAEPVLDPPDGRPAAAGKIRAAVLPLLRDRALGRHVGFAVRDLPHDRDLLSYGSGLVIPASTLKLFTSLAALEAIEPDRRFRTIVTSQPGPGGRRLVLIGGGDPLLATRKPAAASYPEPATLTALATRTAKALRADGARPRVRLGFDDSLFSRPAVSPHWEDDYIADNVATPVSALWVDEGITSTAPTARTRTPARAAATAFAVALERAGVTVRGAVQRTNGSDDGAAIASVSSPTLTQIVQLMLETSDNESAEVVLRHLAIAEGKPATFGGGSRAVLAVLAELGVPLERVEIHDGSGLARDNVVTTEALLSVLTIGAGDAEGGGRAPVRLRPIVTGLPVAGFNGSLAGRFVTPGTAGGLGLVRAKTGTLTGVHALAGVTVDAEGTTLAFVAVADEVKVAQTLDARAVLDEIAAALTTCACSR